MDFRTYEGALEIFKSLNCVGNENCIFVTFRDANRAGFKAGAAGALIATPARNVGGPILAAAIMSSSEAAMGIEGFDGFLINATEKGLGILPMSVKGVQMLLNADKLEPELDRFIFIPYGDIEKIIVKNFNIFNKKMQKIRIVLNGGGKIYYVARISEKSIPYQEVNFTNFMNKYKNGAAPQVTNTEPIQPTPELQVQTTTPEVKQPVQTPVETVMQKKEENLINNNQETEKFTNQAINYLMTNNFITDYNDISSEYGYLYNIEGHGYEGLFKIKKLDKIFYFAVQGQELQMINLDENSFEIYKKTFLDMHSNN